MLDAEIIRLLKSKGIDPKNLSSNDIKTLLEMNIKQEFGSKVFKTFLEESNVTFKILIDGLTKLFEQSKFASVQYLNTLDWLIKDIQEQINKAPTLEEKRDGQKRLDKFLNDYVKEVENNRQYGKTLAVVAGGVATVCVGAGIFMVTRNSTVLTKGTKLIAKAALRKW
ncbi:hypothetical protein [Bacillus sp. R86525]|uniref:hypothetical protein n=1 Tax=Bacillus sp. R86525 TaxID=3101709 RepID=UPI0036724162